MKLKFINFLIKISLLLIEIINFKQFLVFVAFSACYYKFGGELSKYVELWGIFFLFIVVSDLFRLIATSNNKVDTFPFKTGENQLKSSIQATTILNHELDQKIVEISDLKNQIESLKQKYEPEMNFPDLNAMMEVVETYILKMNKRDALPFGKLLQDMVLEEKITLDNHFTNLFISTAVDIKNIAKPEDLFGDINIPPYKYNLDNTAIEISFEQQKPVAIFFMFHLLNTAKGKSNEITEVLSDHGKKIVFDLGKDIMVNYAD